MAFLRLIAIVAVALSGSRGAGAQDLPADVRAFLERRLECDHWRGEEPYDPERAAEINANVQVVRWHGCTTCRLQADVQRQRCRYWLAESARAEGRSTVARGNGKRVQESAGHSRSS